MPTEPGADLEARLARIAQELDHLKDGLRLLGVRQCCHCGKYFLWSDASNLLDAGQLVCYGCIQDWWRQRSPALASEERQAVEHKLLRWLVAYHNAKVIHHAEKLPLADELELKIVIACEPCKGTGESESGGNCRSCESRGSVWVVGLRPDLQ